LLQRAVAHLKTTSAAGPGISSSLAAFVLLAQAASLLAPPSLPSTPLHHPSPSFPADILSLIVDFAQSATDFHERQITNIALALVSRDWHRAVRPRLLEELHITRAEQLPGLDLIRREHPTRMDSIKVLTIDLDRKDLEWRGDERWPGFYFRRVAQWLGGAKKIVLRLRWTHENDTGGDHFVSAFARVLGTIDAGDCFSFLRDRPALHEFHLDISDAGDLTEVTQYNTVLEPPGAVRALYIDTRCPAQEATIAWSLFFDTAMGPMRRRPWE
jgi:hypothetical protein